MNYAFTNGAILIFNDDGTHESCDKTHPHYASIATAIREGRLEEAADLAKNNWADKVNEKYEEHGVVYDDETESVLINGEKQHSHIAKRVVENVKAGLPFENLLKFIENLEKNVSSKAREELFSFLESQHMPITDDGCFIGYKSVKSNFTDWHSGKFDNRVGKVVSMERRDVDDDASRDCSHGLHVGNYEYASTFRNSPGRQLLLVKVNPADAVSVPKYDCNKMRCCKYEVISLCKEKLPGNVYSKNEDGELTMEDEKWEDENYDWEDDDFWEDEE